MTLPHKNSFFVAQLGRRQAEVGLFYVGHAGVVGPAAPIVRKSNFIWLRAIRELRYFIGDANDIIAKNYYWEILLTTVTRESVAMKRIVWNNLGNN